MRSPRRRCSLALCSYALALVVLGASSVAEARIERLRWQQNRPDDVTGFSVHVGRAPGVYDDVIDVGRATEEGDGIFYHDLTVADELTVYVAAQAHAQGVDSELSNEQMRPGLAPPPECVSDDDCSDGDTCTGAERCLDASCVAGTALSCEITSQCRVGSCDATLGCVSVDLANGTTCDDGDPMTVGDQCVFGTCQGELPAAECRDDADCSDGDVCTGAEQCIAGSCTPGTALMCEISSQCRVGACDAVVGCLTSDLPDGTACDDGTCRAGVCVADPPPEEPPGPELAALYRTNAGENAYEDPSGEVWEIDDPYVDGGNVAALDIEIAGTDMDPLYASERWHDDPGGPLTWEFPLAAGTYLLRLHFAEIDETVSGPGQRTFDVRVEGTVVLDDYDVFAAAGGLDRAVVEEITAPVDDGSLTLELAHEIGYPSISAIEILSSPPEGSMEPAPDPKEPNSYRVTAGGETWVDPAGYVWDEDASYASRSRVRSSGHEIQATDLDPLYQSQRLSQNARLPLLYEFPVPNGLYLVRLHFAELGRPVNAPGQRLFDVRSEGVLMLADYDVFAAAGGSRTAVVEELEVVVGDGSLSLELTAVLRAAAIAGIEVTPLGDSP